jgi:hypothetical protein
MDCGCRRSREASTTVQPGGTAGPKITGGERYALSLIMGRGRGAVVRLDPFADHGTGS